MNVISLEEYKHNPEKYSPLFRDAVSNDIIVSDPHNSSVEIHKPGAYWIPALGLTDWDGHAYISGATGSGKSYLINQIMKNDLLKKNKKRDHIMFTDLKEADSSIPSDYKKYGEKGIDNAWVFGNMDKNMFIFDDSTSPDVLRFRNSLLEKGRHRKTTVIAVNHRLRDGIRTKELMNESKYVVAFPSSNRGAVGGFMKDYMQMDQNSIRNSLKKSIQDGRHLIFHMWHPNALASKETAWLI